MNLFKVLFLIFTLSYQLYGCKVCAIDVPSVDVKTIVEASGDKTNFDIEWSFHQEFVSKLVQYDLDKNGKLDKEEQNEIKKNLLNDYLTKYNYLTRVIYVPKGTKLQEEQIHKLSNVKHDLKFTNEGMKLKYTFSLDIKLQKDHRLYMSFYDRGNNFKFTIKSLVLKNYDDKNVIKIKNAKSSIYFYNYISKKKKTKEKPEEPKDETYLDILAKLLKDLKNEIQELLTDIKENNSISSYLWLLLFSFAYGVLHAIGPGHGKSLVSAYFLSEERSYMQALNASLLIGVVHTFSAFLLTVFVYYILNLLFASFFSDVSYVATKVSAVIIIAIALYLIIKKYNLTKKHADHKHDSGGSSCCCSGCSTKSTDLSVILAAGIVPCPGTVTIFIFTMSLGIHFVGFLSAVFMSLGMSLVIFIASFLSVKIRKTAPKNEKLIKVFEFGSLIFILMLGLVLLVV